MSYIRIITRGRKASDHFNLSVIYVNKKYAEVKLSLALTQITMYTVYDAVSHVGNIVFVPSLLLPNCPLLKDNNCSLM